ncbi:hypothetical protein H5410_025925 [Solanum commersonii]|uniref:Uncharacterized protein n=1 Tax=Solanum commersonii TaxID=4109 RepID=A0A9J5YV34_SOLCO|nr:hypothetical protein H5410_025925 [Solanum commersonii]
MLEEKSRRVADMFMHLNCALYDNSIGDETCLKLPFSGAKHFACFALTLNEPLATMCFRGLIRQNPKGSFVLEVTAQLLWG